jgi:tetratricopeptide (TPR) repeat protein
MKQFARLRREIMRGMAKQKKIEIPDAVEQYFDALESGDWNEIKAAFDSIHGGEPNAGHALGRLPAVRELWGPIIDAYGVAEQVHLWPAQKLLDYGNAVLGSLRPGMVYVGGTDEGRWIPTLLNETSDGERRIVLTQNGLADSTYLDYLRFLYGDRFATPTPEDTRRAYEAYVADAQKRLDHDKQFPDAPKQMRPGENFKSENGSVAISGAASAAAINEQLLRIIMDTNPDLAFALQESFPFKGTYGEAAPIGAIMELRAQDQTALTPERASQSVAYWRSVADQFRTEPDESQSAAALKSYSKLAVAQANLFAARNLPAQAEQTYRSATEIFPGNVEATTGLADLLARSGRAEDARRLVDEFVRNYPNQSGAIERWKSATGPPQ